jgi:hypothetical protein
MTVPAQFLIPYPASYPNAHDDLPQDTLCDICETGGNVKNVDPLTRNDYEPGEAPETGRAYLWPTSMLARNHRCALCRLIWRTMRHYFAKILDGDLPHAIMGLNETAASDGTRSIVLIAMIYKDTMDNQDKRGSGSVVSSVHTRLSEQQLIDKAYIRRRAYPTFDDLTTGNE